ncbi:hypothetical protein QWY89_08390 [Mucilaginibacter myungsuensis]|nr:hypothetical protein [Mucilaginibacter myungsuensis]
MIIKFDAANTIYLFKQYQMAVVAASQLLAALVPVSTFAVLVLAVACVAATIISPSLDHHLAGNPDVLDPKYIFGLYTNVPGHS